MLSPDLVPPEHGTVLGEAHHDKLPSAVGFTVDAFPQSVQVKEESGLPWMLVLAPTVPLPSSCSTAYPFNEPREGSTVMHQVPRCHRCHGFVSVQCPVLRGRYWECALCGHGNAIPRTAPPLYRPHMHLTPQPGEACVYEVPIPLTGPPPAPSSPGQDYLCAPLPSYVPLSPSRCPALVVLVVLPEGLLVPPPVPLQGPPQPSPVPPAVPALAALLEPLLTSLRHHPSAAQCRLGLWGLTGASLGVVQGAGHMTSLALPSLCPLVQDLGGLDVLCPPMPRLLQSTATSLASSLLLGLGGGQGGATVTALHRVVALVHELAMGHVAPTIEAYRVLALCPALPLPCKEPLSSGAALATPRPHGTITTTHPTTQSAATVPTAQCSGDTCLELPQPPPPPVPQGPTLLPMASLLPTTLAPTQAKEEARQAEEAVEGLRSMAQALARQGRVAVSTLHQDPTSPPPLAAPLQALARATGGLCWQGDGVGACVWAVEGLGCAMAISGEVRSSEGWEVGGGRGEGGHLYSFNRAAAPPQGWGMALGLHYSHAWGLGSAQESRPPVVQLSVAYSVVKGTQLRRRLRVVTLRARGIALVGASVQASACWPLVRYALLQQALALDEEGEGQGAEEAIREWTARAITALAHTGTVRHKDEQEAQEEQEALVGWGYALEEAVVGCRGHEERRAALTNMDPQHSDRALTPRIGAVHREDSTGQLVVQWGTEARQGGAWGVEEGHSTTLVALGTPPQAHTWRALAQAQHVKYVQGDEGWALRCQRLWQQQQGQASHGAQAFREAVQALLTQQPPPPSPHWATGLKHWLRQLSTPLRQLSTQDAHD